MWSSWRCGWDSSRFLADGRIPLPTDMAEIAASTVPEAPSRWPVTASVDLIAGPSVPKSVRISADRFGSRSLSTAERTRPLVDRREELFHRHSASSSSRRIDVVRVVSEHRLRRRTKPSCRRPCGPSAKRLTAPAKESEDFVIIGVTSVDVPFSSPGVVLAASAGRAPGVAGWACPTSRSSADSHPREGGTEWRCHARERVPVCRPAMLVVA